jgi:predicted heme/steroid binding protein/uncharacterized membrane protein
MTSMKNLPSTTLFGFILLCLPGMFLFISSHASATPDYARQTGFECGQCHIDVIGGGPLTQKGREFLADMKSKGLYRPLNTTQHIVRLIIGYLHMMAAIMWFGTIMYVHLLLKPAYASKGLPKGELRLGWLAMIVLLITGTLLTISRIASWDMFITTRFGILLGIKICLFMLMFSSAVIVTIYVGPRLRKQKTLVAAMDDNGACTIEGLSQFDGKDGRPAYIAYKGIIYDMSGSRLWKNGAHMMKHAAGNDLTDILKTAPHGEDKVLAMHRVGTLLASGEKPMQPFHLKLFYFFAYLNLVLVFVITFVIALWRWW